MRRIHLIVTVQVALFSASCLSTSGALSVVPLSTKKDKVASCPSISLEASQTSSEDVRDGEYKNSASSTSSRFRSYFRFDKVVDPYHLLWSPGFVKKMATTTVLLLTARNIVPTTMLASHSWTVPPAWQAFASTIGLPLLASACCALQLAINLVAGGCAGFNTVLGPVRPFSMGLLLVLSVFSNPNGFTSTASVKSLAVKWSIALLPEGLHLFNTFVLEATRQRNQSQLIISPSVRAHVELDIPTMGCVACINSIDKALMKSEHVLQASASLHKTGVKGGKAIVELGGASEKDIQEGVNRLCAVVEKAGFGGCTVKTVKTAVGGSSY